MQFPCDGYLGEEQVRHWLAFGPEHVKQLALQGLHVIPSKYCELGQAQVLSLAKYFPDAQDLH